MSREGSYPVQTFAAPVPIRPRSELTAENELLRQIVELQAQVMSLTERNVELEALADTHAWEVGYKQCMGCRQWLPERAFSRNGVTRLRSRCPECDATRRRALRETAG